MSVPDGMTAVFKDLLFEAKPPIVVITFNRPSVRNAFRHDTALELASAVRLAAKVPGVRAVILTGVGDQAFSAGADLKELRTRDPAQRDLDLVEGFGNALRVIETSSLPVIAAVRGFALGGGMEIAMACHLRIAGQSAVFGQPEILRGHIPGAGGTVRFPRLTGTNTALQYLLTGDRIDAREAHRLRLVNWVVPDAEVESFAEQTAKRIAALSRVAVELTLQSVMTGRDMPVEQALAFELSLCSRMRHASDYREGLEAFSEHREANYNGQDRRGPR
jgi:enoyl-CoA hydratase